MNAALRIQPSPGEWMNPLPAWIRESAEYAGLSHGHRAVLQAICNRGREDARHGGAITGAFGGASCCEAAGVSRSTFFKAIKRLEQLGFIVTMARGGNYKATRVANVYGIPLALGQLDDFRVQREVRRMQPQLDGTYRPETIKPGDQATFWSKEDLAPTSKSGAPKQAGCEQRCEKASGFAPKRRTRASRRHGTRVTMTLDAHHGDTPTSHIKTSLLNGHVGSHGDGASADPFSSGPANSSARRATTRSGSARPPHIDDAGMLRSVARLRHYRERLGGSGLAGPDEKGFVACACKAVRIGKRPAAMFVHLLRLMAEGGGVPVENEDQAEAQRMIRAFEEGRQ